MVFRSPLPDIALPQVSLFDLAVGNLGADASLPAITETDTSTAWTYGELTERAEAVAALLATRGIGPGDVVTLRISNSAAFAAGLLGITRAGAAAALIGPLLNDAEAGALAALAGATTELTAEDVARAEITTASLPTPSPDDLAAIAFSSGTTGLPKAVELTHRALTANAAQFGAALAASGIPRGTRTLAPLPFTHIYGLNTLLIASLAARHHVHTTTSRFDLAHFAAAHKAHRIELTFIAPPIALGLAASPAVDPAQFTSTRHMVCGAAPLDESLARTVEERLGVTILQGYGTTESAPVTHVGIAGASSPGSIGFAVPNTQYRIVALGTQRDVADGEAGELIVRGPQLMRGYRGNPEATAQALISGWLHTGDIAKRAPDGSVWIVDRAKDVIKYHGYQVSPAELEAIIRTHPDIEDAAVVGFTRGDGEEVPRAFVVGNRASISKEALMSWVAERVAPYKKVRDVVFVAEIPKNAAGKILRRELRGLGS